jgi:sugar phosphate isomerase/epimerase
VRNHHRWVDAARTLGCATIRVNAASEGSWEEQARLAADGLRRLCEYGEGAGINVIVENHGGLSSNGKWLAQVMRLVDHPRCGTLPDFGNFNLGDGQTYDRYLGVAELMPFAKAVSAKSHDFDQAGNETATDYRRMIGIVLDAGFRSWIGIEYEGDRLPEREGIRLTQRLLERVRAERS